MARWHRYGLALIVLLPALILATINWNRPQEASLPAFNTENLVRFHVIANSDNPADQALKLQVRDAVLKDLVPRLAQEHNSDETLAELQLMRTQIEAVARQVVTAAGRDEQVTAQLGVFPFPLKAYGELALPAGDYKALRLVIGEGEGQNWWCVLFPPLCLVDLQHTLSLQTDAALPVAAGDKTIALQQTDIQLRWKVVDELQRIWPQGWKISKQ